MGTTRPNGCLAAILSVFGISLSGRSATAELPYRCRDDFLSAAELSFYRVLANGLAGRALICPKVNLADIFFVPRSDTSQAYRNKIDRKHVDFLICEPQTLRPLCGVELDDSTHAMASRQERDEFIEQVFAVAELPLVRVPARAAYRPAELLALVEPHLTKGRVPVQQPAKSRSNDAPLCPKCNVPMVKRIAKQGKNAGNAFFGCPNYPRCREIANID